MAQRKRSKRASGAEWQRRVLAWRRSGLSAREFSRRRGLTCGTLQWWAWRLGRTRDAAEAAGLARLEVEGIGEPSGTAVTAEAFELALPGGTIVRVAAAFDAMALRRLLDCLREQGPC